MGIRVASDMNPRFSGLGSSWPRCYHKLRIGLSLGAAPVAMAAPAQQNKMKACNEQANAKEFGEGKGGERKAFMKGCLRQAG